MPTQIKQAFSISEIFKSIFTRPADNLAVLDGLRAISIIWVVVFHVFILHQQFHSRQRHAHDVDLVIFFRSQHKIKWLLGILLTSCIINVALYIAEPVQFNADLIDFNWLIFTIPVCLLLSAIIAILLFIFIEKPFMNLRGDARPSMTQKGATLQVYRLDRQNTRTISH